MANVNINVNANTSNANQQLNQVNTTINQISNSTANASEESKGWASGLKDVAGSIVSNYNNIKGILTDIVAVYDDANKSQQKWNFLIQSDSYKKYANQIDDIASSTQNMTTAYENVDTLQKLFASGVDLSGDKLKRLTEVATYHAQKMGVDVTDSIQRFTESVAESTTSKLEDLGVYINAESVILNYALANGIAKDEIDDLTKKQIILDSLLKTAPQTIEKNGEGLKQLTVISKQFKQNIDEIIVTLGDTVGEGLMYWANEHITTWQIVGEKLYDIVHVFDETNNAIEEFQPTVQQMTTSVNKMADAWELANYEMTNLGRSGITAFKGIMIDNQSAVEKISAEYKKKAEEIRKWKEWDKEQAKKEALLDDERQKDIENMRDTKDKKESDRKKALAKIEYDNQVEKYNNMKKIRDTKLKEDEKIWEDNQKEEQKKKDEEFKLQQKNEEEIVNMKEKMGDIALQNSANFSAMLINDVLLGEKEFRLSMIGDFVKGIGTQMVADGTFQTLSGLAKAWGGNPAGWKQAEVGGIEVGMGIGMGGVGKIFGGSGGSTKDEKTSASDKNDISKSKQNNSIGITTYLYPNAKSYYRQQVADKRKMV